MFFSVTHLLDTSSDGDSMISLDSSNVLSLSDYLHQHATTCHFEFSDRLLIEKVIYSRKYPKELKTAGQNLLIVTVQYQCPAISDGIAVLKDILPTTWSKVARCTVCPCDPLLNYLHRIEHSSHSEIGVTVCDGPVSPRAWSIKDKREDLEWRVLQKVLGSQWEKY